MNPRKKSTIGLKIISILLAVLLWYYVVNQGELTARPDSVEVTLEYHNLAEGLSIDAPDKVTVKLWGSFKEPGQIKAFVDLSGLDKGDFRLPVNVEPVKGTMLTTVNPDIVNVTLQEISEHRVPVNYEITRDPLPGYQLLDIVTVPDHCIIKGEEEIVSQVKSVVSPVDLSNIIDTSSFSTRLTAVDAQGNYINGNIRIVPEKVTVYVVVAEKRAAKKVPVKPLITGKAEDGYQVQNIIVEPELINLLGSENRIGKITSLETEEINLAGKKETFNQEIAVQIPENSRVAPATVKVTVEIVKIDNNEVEE